MKGDSIIFRLSDIQEKKAVIVLQKSLPEIKKTIFSLGIFSVSSVIILLIIHSLGVALFYGLILEVALFIFAVIGILYGGYQLANTIYEQPIMILTLNNIYLGKKLLFRSPYVKPSGILPKGDLQLIIVRDSKLNVFKLYLEGRELLQLGIYRTLQEVTTQRMKLRESMAIFYPQIYISLPIYQEI